MTTILPMDWKRMRPPRESSWTGRCPVCSERLAQWEEALRPDGTEQLPSLERGFLLSGRVWQQSDRWRDHFPLSGKKRKAVEQRLGLELPPTASANARGPEAEWGGVMRCRKDGCRALVELVRHRATIRPVN